MRTIIFALAVVVLALTGVRTYAADVTPRRYSLDEPTAYNWTGGYFGIHGGYVDHSIGIGGDSTPDQNPAGGFGGAQTGYNYQFSSNVVAGVELDISMGQSSDEQKDGKSIVQESTVDLFGSVRGKLGYSFGRVMPYGTAGLAFEQASLSESCPAGVEFGHCSKTGKYTDKTKYFDTGLIYGGGVLIGLTPELTVFAEYLNADFGKDEHKLGNHSSDRSADQDASLVRGGLNYRW